MKTVYLLLIILLISSPIAETRKLKKITKKKEIATLALTAAAAQVGIHLINQIIAPIRYYRQAKLSKKVHASMIEAIKKKDELMVDMMHDCRSTLTVQDHVLTSINEMILIVSKIPNENISDVDCEKAFKENELRSDTKSSEQKNHPQNEVYTKCLRKQLKEKLNEIIKKVAKAFSFELSENCEHQIFPFLDDYNRVIGQKKTTLAELELKMNNSRTFIVKIINLFTERADYSKMADSQKFGSVNTTKIVRKRIGMSWTGIHDYLKSLLKIATPATRGVIALNQKDSYTELVWTLSFLKLFRVISEIAEIVKVEMGFSSYSSQVLANTVFQKSKLDLNTQKMQFVSYLKGINSLKAINDLHKKVNDMKNDEKEMKLDKIYQTALPEDLNQSIIFRDLASKNKALPKTNEEYQNIFGLYFADIEIAYNLKEVELLNQNGFEVIQTVNLGSNGKRKLGKTNEEGYFYVLGRRYTTSKEIVFFAEAIPFSDLDVKADQIGSDYQDYLKAKFHPIMRKKLQNLYEENCSDGFSVGEIYNLVDVSQIKVRLTYDHYVVNLVIQREFLDKDKNKKHVNCVNKYKKFAEGEQYFKICGKKDSLVYQFCETTKTSGIKASEIKEFTEAHMIYYLVHKDSPGKGKLESTLLGLGNQGHIRMIGDYSLVSYLKKSVSEVVLARDFEKDVNSKLCKVDFIKSLNNSLYGDVWANTEEVDKGLKELNIEIKNNEILHGTLKKGVHGSTLTINGSSRKRKQLLIKNSALSKYIPLEDYVQLILDKKVVNYEILNRKATLEDDKGFNQPFIETFTGFYHDNTKCASYKDLIKSPYVTSYLGTKAWSKTGTLISALITNRNPNYYATTKVSRSYFSLSDHLKVKLKKKEKGNYEILHRNDSDYSAKLTKTKLAEIIAKLKDCEYASLAVNVKFEEKDIDNPKIAIYPHENDIEIDLVEGTDKDLKFTGEVALTFSLIDIDLEANATSNFTKFEIMNNFIRRVMRRGYLKAETFEGESNFKLEFPGWKKYILVNVWSRIDMEDYQRKYKDICSKEKK